MRLDPTPPQLGQVYEALNGVTSLSHTDSHTHSLSLSHTAAPHAKEAQLITKLRTAFASGGGGSGGFHGYRTGPDFFFFFSTLQPRVE